MRCNIALIGVTFVSFLVLKTNTISAREHTIDSVTITTTTPKLAPTKQSAPTQIISAEKMEQLGIESLSEAIATFSGVQIKDYGGIGGVKSVSVRSMGAAHTAVSYDGVTISNAQGGVVDLSSFSLNDISDVSLTIGQGDDIFLAARNFASSSIINIRSSAPTFTDKNFHLSATYQMGSFSSYDPQILLAAKLSERWSLSAKADWLTSAGDYPFTLENYSLVTEETRTNSDVNILRSELNLYGDVGTSGKLNIKGSYLDSERGLPGSVNYYDRSSNERLWDKVAYMQVGYDTRLDERWALSSHLKYNYTWCEYYDKLTSGDYYDEYTQMEYYASLAAEYRATERLSFTAAEDLIYNTLEQSSAISSDPTRLTSLTSVAAKYATARLTVIGSLLNTRTFESVDDGTIEPEDRNHFSPALSLSYRLLRGEDLRLRASFKDSFRLPTFTDLYYDTFSSRDLDPEIAKQYNIGVTYSSGVSGSSLISYLSLSCDGYYNTIEDKIIAIPTMFVWKMLNRGEVEIKGLDLNAMTTLNVSGSVRLNLAANYTYQHAIDLTDSSDKNYGDQIPYTPRHSAAGDASLSCRWFELGYRVNYVGERYSNLENIEFNYIESYLEQSLSLSRTFALAHSEIKVRGDIQNIGDVNYDVIKFYPMAGRNYKLSITYQF